MLRGSGKDEENNFELNYDDFNSKGLCPLPSTMSKFLLGLVFDWLLEQVLQIEINGLGRAENPSTSKAVIESMPTVEITESHVVLHPPRLDLNSTTPLAQQRATQINNNLDLK